MKDQIQIPLSLSNQAEYKRKFTFTELYKSLVTIPKAISTLSLKNKNKQLSPEFIERLQLAVTEVNGCPACSYQHTKMALRQGMSNEEITSFLTGGNDFIIPTEAKAILFAQHYADSRGFPTRYAYDAIVEEYGETKASIIISATQVMLAGNIYGIPYSAFISRLKGTPYKDSSIVYEIIMLIGGIFILPVALLHGLLKMMFRIPSQKFNKTRE